MTLVYNKCYTGLLVTLLVIWTSSLGNCQDYTLRKCLRGKNDNRTLEVNMSCPEGQVISLVEAIIGTNKWGLCSHTLGDCTEKIINFNKCNGFGNCTVSFNGTYTTLCGYATFLRAIYDCVSAEPGPRVRPNKEDKDTRPSTERTMLQDPSNSFDGDPTLSSTDDEDIPLIVGCAVAVLVTTVVLIFAIILVVRRLTSSGNSEESTETKKQGGMSVLICTKVGCLTLMKCKKGDVEGGTRRKPGLPDNNQNFESRVEPVGADFVEEPTENTRELDGQPPEISSATELYANTRASVVSDSVTVSATGIESSHTNMVSSAGLAASPGNKANRTSQAEPIVEGQSSKMDAVAIPNTELSTLC